MIVGSLVDVGEQSWFSFRHWGCVTSAQIGNFLAAYGYESSPEIIQGFEKLTPEDQAKVALAYSVGHVADEDIPETARKGPQTPRTPNSSHVERVEPPTPTPKRSRSDPIVKGVKRGKKISYEVDLEHGNSDDDQAEVDYDVCYSCLCLMLLLIAHIISVYVTDAHHRPNQLFQLTA